MNTTKILGEAVGIQRQDIIDQTEEQLADSLSSAAILGRFKRGRLDKTMAIYQGNIRGQLGYDPKNPDYIAVQDCLDTGVPSVQVLRLSHGGEGAISVGISPDLPYRDDWTEDRIHWAIEVNGTLYPTKIGNIDDYSYLHNYLRANEGILGLTGKYEDDESIGNSAVYISNITNTRKFVRLLPDKPYTNSMTFIGNPTSKIDSNGVISFWLDANDEAVAPILCTPTEEFTVKVLKTDYQENDVLRAAWRITDENGNVTIGNGTYTLSDYYDPDLNNYSERYGFSPLALISGVYDLQGQSIDSYYRTADYDPWQSSCIGGTSVMSGSLTGRGLADFTSSSDMNVTVQVMINGVDRSFTVQHPFYTAVEGSTENFKLMMTKVSDQLNLLGFRSRLVRGYLYQGATGRYWGHHIAISYDLGQFESVSIGGNSIIDSGFTPRWDAVNFFESCEISKNGVNTPEDSYAVFRGIGRNEEGESSGLPYIFFQRTIEFLPCADLGVALNAGEIDFIPTTDHPAGFTVSGCGFYAGG